MEKAFTKTIRNQFEGWQTEDLIILYQVVLNRLGEKVVGKFTFIIEMIEGKPVVIVGKGDKSGSEKHWFAKTVIHSDEKRIVSDDVGSMSPIETGLFEKLLFLSESTQHENEGIEINLEELKAE